MRQSTELFSHNIPAMTYYEVFRQGGTRRENLQKTYALTLYNDEGKLKLRTYSDVGNLPKPTSDERIVA